MLLTKAGATNYCMSKNNSKYLSFDLRQNGFDFIMVLAEEEFHQGSSGNGGLALRFMNVVANRKDKDVRCY